jgi:hypothetical protein
MFAAGAGIFLFVLADELRHFPFFSGFLKMHNQKFLSAVRLNSRS